MFTNRMLFPLIWKEGRGGLKIEPSKSSTYYQFITLYKAVVGIGQNIEIQFALFI
jgi:hypothetical protein